MKTYKVIFECRRSGAIGSFYPVDTEVSATNKMEATDKAFTELHNKGYETRFPVSIEEKRLEEV